MNLHRALGAFAVTTVAVFAVLLSIAPHDTLEACRMVNVVLGLGTAAGFFIRVNDAWARYGLGGRIVRAGLLMVLCVVAAGSAEAYVTHAELGYRSAFMTAALLTTAVGLALIPNDDA